MPSDRLSVFLHSTTLKRQLVTLGREATFVETWHAQFQTTHQNRCLHSFGERRGALILHLVAPETEVLQGGVRLVVLQSSDRTKQQTSARMLPHKSAPAWFKFHPQRMPCEVLFAALAHVVSTFVQHCRVERVLRVVCWPKCHAASTSS